MDDFAYLLVGLAVAIPLFVTVYAIGTLLNGWALHLLWLWFIVPIFNLPALSIGQAIGLGMIVSFLTYHYQASPKDKDENLGTFILFLIRPVSTVLLAMVIKQFI